MIGRAARLCCWCVVGLLAVALDPSVPEDLGGTGCPTGSAAMTAAHSVVSVLASDGPRLGTATGFSAGGERIVTVAHIALGADAVRVMPLAGGYGLPARVVTLDTRRDLAVLDVPGLRLGALRPAATGAAAGSCAAVLTARGGVVVRVDAQVLRPVRVSIDVPVPARRAALQLAADIRRGDSGAPVLDSAGRVEGVVFAVSRDGPPTAWAVDASELRSLFGG